MPLYDTNVRGLTLLLDESLKNDIKLFVNASTAFVYDGKSKVHKINPISLYAATKLQGELLCDYYGERGMQCVTFRQFPAYGEFDNARKFIPFIIQSALKGETTELKTSPGYQKWDYIYVDDIVDAYMSLISSPPYTKAHEIFDIGTGHAPTLRTTINLILNLLNSKINPVWGAVPYRNNEMCYACADTYNARKLLHWKAKTTLYDGMKKTIDWYKEHNRRD